MCGGTPDAPDMGPQAAASRYAVKMAERQSKRQMVWAREQWDRQEALLRETVGVQSKIMEEQWQAGKDDRARYEEKYQAMEDNLIDEFKNYDTPERKEQERGRAVAAHQQAADQQRENSLQRLEAYGIDPSQTRTAAMDTNARIQLAANQANAANASDRNVDNTGRALRSEAINIGKGYASQVAQSYGQAINAGNSMVGNSNSTVASGASTMGTAQSWQGQMLNANQQSVDIANSNFQNQIQAAEAKNAASPMSAIGDIAGTALGVAGSFGMEEGGSVPGDMAPQPGATDKHPVLLADGEYVIPADVVTWKGEEFFEKLQVSSRKNKAAVGAPPDTPETRAAQGVPA